MAQPNGLNPHVDGISFKPFVLTADSSNSSKNCIPKGANRVIVSGVTNDANDWITLPALADVKTGHEVTIFCSASSNFELRTPASSNEKINGQDSDGTKEALMTDTNIMKVTKISDSAGWMLEGRTAIGAYLTAVVPD